MKTAENEAEATYPPMKVEEIDFGVWFSKNLHWLKSWMDCEKVLLENPNPEEQWYYRSRDCHWDSPTRGKISDIERELTKVVNEEFVPMVLSALVFGTKARYQSGEYRSATISGFFELYGRLPKPEDKIMLVGSEFSEAKRIDIPECMRIGRAWRIHHLEIIPQ